MNQAETEMRELAWIGDAVLALYARRWILNESSIKPENRSEIFKQMTCNQFLSAMGKPTEVEARIGRIYETKGLQAAFEWMEAELLPRFIKQHNRRK